MVEKKTIEKASKVTKVVNSTSVKKANPKQKNTALSETLIKLQDAPKTSKKPPTKGSKPKKLVSKLKKSESKEASNLDLLKEVVTKSVDQVKKSLDPKPSKKKEIIKKSSENSKDKATEKTLEKKLEQKLEEKILSKDFKKTMRSAAKNPMNFFEEVMKSCRDFIKKLFN